MKKREILCAFYNPEIKEFKKYHSFMKFVVENKKKLKPIYFEDDDGKILIVFYRNRLKKISKLLSPDAEEYYKTLMAGKIRHCSVCGCSYLSYVPYTYRDNCGCLGKKLECEICQTYSDGAVRAIRDIARIKGTKKTLMKLLYSDVFEKMSESDDLPF